MKHRKSINLIYLKSNNALEEDDTMSTDTTPLNQRDRARSRRDSMRSELKGLFNLQHKNSATPVLNSINHKKSMDSFQQKYTLMSKIGEGSNAVVRKCKKNDEDNQTNLIVKIMKFQDTEQVFQQLEEYEIASKFNHPNLVKSHDIIIEKNNKKTYIVQEQAKGISLTKLLLKQKTLKESKSRFIINEVLKGLKYLHTRDICHRDLHLGNIIYDKKNQTVKIIDFSISKSLKKELVKMLTVSGIIYFQAPEILQGGYYGKQVDIWSLGIVLYTLLTGEYPFQSLQDNEEQVIESIISEELKFPKNVEISEQMKDLLMKMLDKNPQNRITVQEALNHPVFTQNKVDIFFKSLNFNQDRQDESRKIKNNINKNIDQDVEFVSFQSLRLI